ncbi:MAG: arsenic efflux protein [Mogibacterium sp.]|nr:arsenic efflux protein [Mogibacterium sp.]
MTEIIIEAIMDTIKDTVTLIPFLFITYLAMEWMERRTEEQSVAMLSRIGKFGPVLGSAVGIIPQCGFSAAAASLYSGGVITVGTILAVFLSTSDEMVPIFISSSVSAQTIGKILAAKFIIALITGVIADMTVRIINYTFRTHKHIHDLCEQEHCGCEDEEGGILHSALVHTLKITGFIFIISLVISLLVGFIGKQAMASFMTGIPVLGVFLSGLIGLIPNCAASVVITQLYLEGLLTAGQMMTGLLVGAGVGVLVLLRTNRHQAENFRVIAVLYGSGVAWGLLIDLLGITF